MLCLKNQLLSGCLGQWWLSSWFKDNPLRGKMSSGPLENPRDFRVGAAGFNVTFVTLFMLYQWSTHCDLPAVLNVHGSTLEETGLKCSRVFLFPAPKDWSTESKKTIWYYLANFLLKKHVLQQISLLHYSGKIRASTTVWRTNTPIFSWSVFELWKLYVLIKDFGGLFFTSAGLGFACIFGFPPLILRLIKNQLWKKK